MIGEISSELRLHVTRAALLRVAIFGSLFCPASTNSVAAQTSPQFEKEILPILGKYCLACHGAAMQMGKLDLRTLAGIARGGEQGPAIVKGSAEKSRLFQRVADKSMPPTAGKVSDQEARIIGSSEIGLTLVQNTRRQSTLR
jgi:hypothetical protein